MAHIYAQARFDRTTLLPEDVVVNGFHFDVTGSPVTAAAVAFNSIKKFYDTTPAGASSPIRTYFSRALTGRCEVRVYDWDQAHPRPPIYTNEFTMTIGTTGQDLPTEVAICASYKAAPAAGANPARRRGRIYLGPLNDGIYTTAASSAGDQRPSVGARNIIVSAMVALADDPSTLINWSVYSTKDNVLYPVKTVWCDNAFDTQRRRGAKTTTRTEQTAGSS
jgi:hypothetical protein